MMLINTARLALTIALTAFTSSTAFPQAGMDPERLSRISTRMQEFVDEGVISGAVMLLARHGEVVFREAVGYQDVESQEAMHTSTIFQIKSMTKPVTAVGIMILIEEGRLTLNDPVEMHLPEFKGQTLTQTSDSDEQPGMQQPVRPITIRDLLTHTSGMPQRHNTSLTDPELETLEEVVATNAQHLLEFEPGTNVQYSNLGFQTLGRIIEVVSDMPYERFLRERIFLPLGMKDSFFTAPPEKRGRIASIYELVDGKLTKSDRDPSLQFRFPSPSGGMFSTAADMFVFYQMTLQGGKYDGMRILSRASVDAMTALHISIPLGGTISGLGLGWWVVGEPIGTVGLPLQSNGSYGHGGFLGTLGWVDPDKNLVGVFLIHQLSELASKRREVAQVFVAMATAAIVE